jgi:hypothetical protein
LALCSLASAYAQSMEDFFTRYSDQDGVSSIYISKAMLGLMPNMKSQGVDIGGAAAKLDHIRILNCDRKALIPRMRKDLADIGPKNGYEELMRTKEDGEVTAMYLKELKNGKKEFVLINIKSDEVSVITITGSLTMEEIQKITHKQK